MNPGNTQKEAMEFLKRLFGYHKTPPVLVNACLFELDCIIRKVIPKHGRRLEKRFWQMKNFLFGKGDREPLMEECEELALFIEEKHVCIKVLLAFEKLTFEERKSFAQVFCTLLNRNHHSFATEYMISMEGKDILQCIISNYGKQFMTINSGLMLRESIKIRPIHEVLYQHPQFIKPLFTEYMYNGNFDVCSDVSQTIHDLLRKNKQLVSYSLDPSRSLYHEFFQWYEALLKSDNYVICRLSIKLLSEVLLDKINFDIMIAFVGEPEYLKLFMNLLCSEYPTIQYEAFNVFKIFVANPDKKDPVARILRTNRDMLIPFLAAFLPSKDDDEVFVDEKKLLATMLTKL